MRRAACILCAFAVVFFSAPALYGEEQQTEAGIEIKKEVYKYTSVRRRDPFFSLVTAAKLERETKKKGLTPLEDYDVSQLKLSAVVWAKDGYYALVGLPDGKSYTIRRGTVMGIHGGKVVRITEDSLTVREFIKDFRGILSPRDTVLRLRQEEER